MADKPVVHIGENSPEEVALKLFYMVHTGSREKDTKAILDLYAECLMAVRQPQDRAPNYQ